MGVDSPVPVRVLWGAPGMPGSGKETGMGLEEQLADTSAKVAHLTGKLDIVIPRLDGMMPRTECAVRHDGLEKLLETHREIIREEIRKNGNGTPKLGLKLIALAASAVAILGVAIDFLGRIALRAVGIGP